MSTKEMALYLFNKAILQTYSCSIEMKFNEAKEIVFNQLSISKMFLFDACQIDNKHCKKTLAYIVEVKAEITKLNFNDYELLSSKK
jgi:hypothetical protein